ncbi:MAG: hypothetical protein Q4B22_01485 [Eubacteriales bacterium]|nr:hypothetical protein [Eubacteriales bacterium]
MSERRIAGYDPQTGEPIYEHAPEDGKIIGYDPQTGAPIYENAKVQDRKIIGFDPQTGAPIYENAKVQDRKIIGYDPQTGAPVYENVQTQSRRIIGYDSQTGVPIYERQEAGSRGGYQADSGQNDTYGYTGPGGFETVEKTPKKSKKGLIIGGIAVAAAVVLAAGGIKADAAIGFGKPGTKILAAAQKTFAGDDVTAKLKDAGNIIADNKFAVNVEVNLEDAQVRIDYAQDKTGQSAVVELNDDDEKYDFQEYMDENAVYLNSSLFSDTIMYPYTQEEYDGDLKDLAGESNLENIDESLKLVYMLITAEGQKGSGSDAAKVVLRDFNDLKFEKLKAKDIELEGNDVKCSGYGFTIDADFMEKLKDDLDKENGDDAEELQDALKKIAKLTGNNELRTAAAVSSYDFDDMPDLDFEVYLNKGRIAMINLETEVDNENIEGELVFAGSKVPWHQVNMTAKAAGQELKGEFSVETSGSEETMTLNIDDFGRMEFKYDTGSGDFSISAPYGLTAEGVCRIEKGRLEYSMDLEKLTGDEGKISVEVTDSYKVKKLSGGKNLKEMSQSEMQDLLEEAGLF